jgi:hypothetical protein
MTTVSDIINLALKDAGVLGEGETASAGMLQDTLSTLNQMIQLWQVEGHAVYALKDVSFPATGATSYTIGVGGNVNRARIDDIEGAFWQANGIDYPLQVIQSFEDYQRIGQKSLTGDPCAVHYQPTYPLGVLYVYPAPSTGEVHITVPEEFTEYASSAEDLSLPKKYELAVRFSLAELLPAVFQVPARPDIATFAQRARKVLKRSNLRIPLLQMPAAALPRERFDVNRG